MNDNILDTIFAAKRRRLEQARSPETTAALTAVAREIRRGNGPHRFRRALSDMSRINIIAEFKKASPSKGAINDSADPAATARAYEIGGACAISVLTEEDYFNGSLDDLRAVRSAVSLPILRKDFVFDPFQIYEAAECGADAVLLIAAMLDDAELRELRELAELELGMDALVEVHTAEEMERAARSGAGIIGVNNRDLKTFHVSLDVSRELVRHSPPDAVMIAESGLRTRYDLLELRELGYSGFLIGETLMRSGDVAAELRKLND